MPGRIFGGPGSRKLHCAGDKVKKLNFIAFDEFLLSPGYSPIRGRMNFQQLETLVSLSRLRNYHAVADQLGTTQPSVSLRIQRLEQELGIKLLDRSQNGVSLTPSGRECLAYAEQILSWRGEMLAHAGNSGVLRGRVSMGVSEIIADTWLAQLLKAMAAERPAVVVDSHVGLTPMLSRGLDDATYDVILVGSSGLAPEFATRSLGCTPVSWMAAPGAFTTDAPLTPQDLQRLPLITWPRQSAIHGRMASWFAAHHAQMMSRHTCNSVISMARLAVNGLGVALLPPRVVEQELASGALAVIPTTVAFPPVKYRAIYDPRRSALGAEVARIAAGCTIFDPEEEEAGTDSAT
jgi:DNA-binding transcriptional LysR family regulator